MPNLTVSTDVDNFMQAADNAAARTSLGLGTAAVLDAPATGDASVTEVAKGDDTRLTDSRTPLAHKASHAIGQSDALSPADIGAVSTSDVIAIVNGGTGATTDSTARTALSAAQSGANTDLTSVTLTTGTITGVPGSANDIVNKSYADAIASSINFHEACDYATIAALSPAATYNQPGGAGVGVNATLTGGTNVALQVDGVTVSTTQRILVKNQGSAFENGIYTVTQQGDGSTVPYILTRATDYDTSGSAPNEVQAGDFILILNSTLANTAWVQQTPAPINFGVTSLTFIQFAAAAAGVSSFNTSLTGLTPSSNTTGAVTLAGTLGLVSGGTGQSTQAAAITALTGTQTSGTYLRSDGTNAALAAIQAGDVPTLNQNTSGTAAGLSATLAVASGGTGQTAYTDGQLLVGNTATGGLSKATITAGSNVTVTNGNGTITIASTAASGVSSFSAGTTGLTPNTATTGAVSLAGTLAVANGGTAATDAGTALLNLGVQLHPVTVRSSNNQSPSVLTGPYAGTWTGNTLTLTTGTTSLLAVGMCFGTTGLTGVAITAIVNSQTVTLSNSTTTQATPTALTIYNNSATQFTLGVTGVFTLEGYNVGAGDTVVFSNQTSTLMTGPWVCTTAGAVGVAPVFQRPSWFTGTASAVYVNVLRGNSSQGSIFAIYPLAAAITDIVVGQTPLSSSLIFGRANNALLAGNTFAGKNTFQAGATGSGAVPYAFQAGVLMTTPQAHSVEWDGKSMYLTTDVSARTTNVVATAIPPTATSAGVAGHTAVDNTGSWLYVCTATNIWKRVLLTTF